MAMTRNGLRAAGLVLAAFAGGAVSHWLFSPENPACAQIVLGGGGVFQTGGAIRAGSLELSDKQNNLYAEITLRDGSPVLALYDKSGRECLAFRVDNKSGETSLHVANGNKKSQAEIEIAVSPDGAPRMKLKNDKGERAWEAP